MCYPSEVIMCWTACTNALSKTQLKPHTCHKLWFEPHEIGQTLS